MRAVAVVLNGSGVAVGELRNRLLFDGGFNVTRSVDEILRADRASEISVVARFKACSRFCRDFNECVLARGGYRGCVAVAAGAGVLHRAFGAAAGSGDDRIREGVGIRVVPRREGDIAGDALTRRSEVIAPVLEFIVILTVVVL